MQVGNEAIIFIQFQVKTEVDLLLVETNTALYNDQTATKSGL